jgi:RES domain-containing protein
MIVYRLTQSRFSRDLSGRGARLFGGRWNHVGSPCIYSSESRALAVLEFTVNTGLNEIPPALIMISIDTGSASIEEIAESRLPRGWQKSPALNSTKDFGTALLNAGKSAVIKIPSVIIPGEYNYLLNPLHKDAGKFKIIQWKDFIYDLRIKK